MDFWRCTQLTWKIAKGHTFKEMHHHRKEKSHNGLIADFSS